MTKNLTSLVASMIALLAASSPALALSSRTFVSGAGSDTGVCPVTTPCRTFAYALTQTAPSGEIIVLSSAGYGTVTITQAVSIINTSNFAGVTVASGNGITINAGTSDSVTLRGLTIDGAGTGSNGIVFNSGGKLTIDQCDVLNFVGGTASAGNGILMRPTSGNHNIVITNTTASNNQFAGVVYSPLSSTATTGIVIDRVSANNNNYGIAIDNGSSSGAATASISNSIGSFNSTDGFYFASVTASISNSTAIGNGNVGFELVNIKVSMDASYANGNGSGIVAANSSTLALGRSVIANNGFGVSNNSSTVNSYKNNQISGNNFADISGTLFTPVSPQ